MRTVRLLVLTLAAALLAAAPAAAQAPTAGARIINGSAPTQAWPAQTSVQLKTSSGTYVCGGTLVGARWVLTAAHCATNADGSVLQPRAFSLRVGSTSRTSGGTAVLVDNVIRHPDYDADAYTNDLALLHLATPVLEEPLRLVGTDAAEAALWSAGTQATIIGWGVTEDGRQATSLREAQVPVVGDDSCGSDWLSSFSPASMVCAGGGSSDTCSGDSGGPLIVPGDGGFVLVGVTSWGSNPCADPGVPGVYARVGAPALNAWLRSYLTAEQPAAPPTTTQQAPPMPPPPTELSQEPQQQEQQPPQLDAPAGTVAVPAHMKLSSLRGKRLRVRFDCDRACTISGRLTLDARSARRFGLGRGRGAVTIGRGKSSLAGAGSRMLTVTLTPKARRALRNRSGFTLRLRTDLRSGTSHLPSTHRITVSR
jgi:secreted trypsin-like serine protease